MSSKWIEVSPADAPASKVAQQALAARAAKVMRMLPLAAHHYRQDLEYVHQLRTSCRRATAALKSFRPLMDGKPRDLTRLLRKIHRAAGPARDADVLLVRYGEELPADSNVDYLIARLELLRDDAQDALLKVARKSQLRKLKKAFRNTLKRLELSDRNGCEVSFADFGRGALESASRDVFHINDDSQPAVAQLHRLRIAGKRLRYSIELFHSVFPPELREEIYPQIEQLQERLGKLNDHATAQALFQGWLAKLPPGQRAADLAQRVVAEHDTAVKVRQDFLDWWSTDRIATLASRLRELLQPRD